MKTGFMTLLLTTFLGTVFAVERYEAEDAIVDINSVQKVSDPQASGGFYVGMKEGALSFKVNVSSAGFYTLWTCYSQPSDQQKIQNLTVNGTSAGQISFALTDTFVNLKASSKIKLSAGDNIIGITKSWGWVNIDYIEITPYQDIPFSIDTKLVSPNASKSAQNMFDFLYNSFQHKIISGVMTNTVMENDGKYTPNKIENQTEVKWIKSASSKIPALLGFDLFHGTGLNSDGEWYKGYTNATIAMAEELYSRGGIPIFCWHWKDPNKDVEAFYSPSTDNTTYTDFNLKKAYKDSTTCAEFDSSSKEFKGILQDIDIVATYLKKLADKDIPVLWRPLHEASGGWFWWGYKGAKACKTLYHLLFQRLTEYHHLNNLIWVWTTDESNDALDWYPGDEYVDIVGRDYYYYPREANHSSLVASFEKLKELYNGKKIVTLSENGSIPHPDSLIADGAGWSFFMPWYGDYTMDGWAHDNTAEDWNSIMNHDYVITLDKMPGWEKVASFNNRQYMHKDRNRIEVQCANNTIKVLSNARIENIGIFSLQGVRISDLNKKRISACANMIHVNSLSKGMFILRIKTVSDFVTVPVLLK